MPMQREGSDVGNRPILKSEVRSDMGTCISGVRAYGQYTGWESLRVWNSIWFLLPLDPRRRKRRWVGRERPGGWRWSATPEKGVLPGARDWPDILQDPATHIANYQLYDPLALRSLWTSDDSSHFQTVPVTSAVYVLIAVTAGKGRWLDARQVSVISGEY